MKNYSALKNGSDIRGTAIAGENDPVTLTEEAISEIASAFCVWLLQKKQLSHPVIAVGHDPRLSSKDIENALVEGFTKCGAKVILTGLSSTPSMFMLLQSDFGADASVMITASHLPYRKNGLKFFLPEGGVESEELGEILALAEKGACLHSDEAPFIVEKSYLERYAQGLVDLVRRETGAKFPLAGKKIVVDAGGGAGGFYASSVLQPLGADTSGSQFLEPDGSFSGHIPNPENAEAMRALSEAVLRSGADLGVIFDTDVDRAALVSSDGKEINRNRLIALISAILLEERKGAYIVTDSVTSDGLTKFIAARGGVHHRFKRGYKNVINESKRLCAEGKYSPLAIETSGHAAFAENYFLDDGAYLVARVLIALAKAGKNSLNSLIKDLEEPAEALEVRLAFDPLCDVETAGMGIIEDFKRFADSRPYLTNAPDCYEGARVNFDEAHGNGWVLLRRSLHEPILPVNAESAEAGGATRMLRELYGFLKGYPFLDLTQLEKIIA